MAGRPEKSSEIMRDLSQTSSAEALNGGLFSDPLATSALLDVRTRLAHALQTTLDTGELLSLFFRYSRQLVDYNGLSYESESCGKFKLGHRAVHRCLYNMTLPDADLGSVTFFRKTRFSDDEQKSLETLLASLAFPLRNAQQYRQAMQMALVDPLTRVGNRAAMEKALEREHQLLQRNGKPFALLMVDIDHFKQVNDRFGHGCGDQVIAKVAKTIEQVSRSTDMTFRYGGEEFALLLSATGAAGALITAERLRRAIEKLKIRHADTAIAPTASIGVSACVDPAEPLTALVERADRALYSAKRAGRNRSCCEAPAHTLKAVTQ